MSYYVSNPRCTLSIAFTKQTSKTLRPPSRGDVPPSADSGAAAVRSDDVMLWTQVTAL
jgi:hypothetical protein